MYQLFFQYDVAKGVPRNVDPRLLRGVVRSHFGLCTIMLSSASGAMSPNLCLGDMKVFPGEGVEDNKVVQTVNELGRKCRLSSSRTNSLP